MSFRPTNGFLLDKPIKRLTAKSAFLRVLEKFQYCIATDPRIDKTKTVTIPNKYIKDLARSPR